MEERNFRPLTLTDFIGQAKIKQTLGLMLNSARIQGMPLEHVVFFGPPGLGKTTLAQIIANEQAAALREVSAPSVERLGDLVAILVALRDRDVLFVDEIHALKRETTEVLYSAMEDFVANIPVKGGSAETGATPLSLPLRRFTLVGATTDFGLLPGPLRARFGHLFALDLYSVEELEKVVMRAAGLSEVLIDQASAAMIAERARGTPRIALRLFRRTLDVAISLGEDLTLDVTQQAMSMLEIDELGLDDADRRYLAVLAQIYHGGPVGPKSLAASTGFDEATVTQAIEPWLLRAGLLARTRLGRRLTHLGWAHIGQSLKISVPESALCQEADLPAELTEPDPKLEDSTMHQLTESVLHGGER